MMEYFNAAIEIRAMTNFIINPVEVAMLSVLIPLTAITIVLYTKFGL